MGINNAEYIDQLNSNDPSFNDKVVDVASHLRAIKKSLMQTFPNFDSALDIGADAINGYEARIAALETSLSGFTQLKIATGRLTLLAATGNSSVTGIGFQPSVLLVATNTVEGAFAVSSANLSIGVTNDTNDYSVNICTDGNSRTTFDRSFYNSALLWNVYTGGANQAAAGTLVSFDSDGFTVNESVGLNGHPILWIAFE